MDKGEIRGAPAPHGATGIGIFDLFCSCDVDLDRWPWYIKLTHIRWRYNGCAKLNFVLKAFKSYRIIACKYVHLVTHGHFQSRDKDGSHTIQSAIAENRILHTNSRGVNSGYRPRKAFCAHVRVECAKHDFWLDGFLRHRNRAVGIFKYA